MSDTSIDTDISDSEIAISTSQFPMPPSPKARELATRGRASGVEASAATAGSRGHQRVATATKNEGGSAADWDVLGSEEPEASEPETDPIANHQGKRDSTTLGWHESRVVRAAGGVPMAVQEHSASDQKEEEGDLGENVSPSVQRDGEATQSMASDEPGECTPQMGTAESRNVLDTDNGEVIASLSFIEDEMSREDPGSGAGLDPVASDSVEMKKETPLRQDSEMRDFDTVSSPVVGLGVAQTTDESKTVDAGRVEHTNTDQSAPVNFSRRQNLGAYNSPDSMSYERHVQTSQQSHPVPRGTHFRHPSLCDCISKCSCRNISCSE